MHVKSIILVALMIASLALARGITSKAEEEDDEDDGTMESDDELAADPVIALTPSSIPECVLAANAPVDRILANMDPIRLPSERTIFDKVDDNKRINIGRRTGLDRIRNGIMRASSYPSSSIWQVLDNFDWLRPSENREGLSSIIPNLIDPLIPPQMQYVDNTLRLMAIKNSMDDLLSKIFPNLHTIQHPTESST